MKEIRKLICDFLLSQYADKVFFANLLLYIQKQECKDIPTMGVTVENGDIVLLYNSQFIEDIKKSDGKKALKGIIEHELLHLVYDHLTRAKKYNRHLELYNIATDMAINQHINKDILPKSLLPTGAKIEKFKKGLPVKMMIFPEVYDLPYGKDAETYYSLLKEKFQNKNKDGNNGDNGTGEIKGNNDHSKWKEVKNEQITKEAIKRAVKEATKQSKNQGDFPSYLQEAIEDLLKKPTINWKHLLKQFVSASIKTGFKSSWKRPNKRFPNIEYIKGKTAKRTIKILCAIDTSGSVSDTDFQDFIAELKGILNCFKSKIDLIQCDTEVQKKETLKPYSKLKINFKGRGGTSFRPVFDYLKTRPDYDLLVYFTDGECGYTGCEVNIPTLWVFTPNGSNTKPPFGNLIRMKKENK